MKSPTPAFLFLLAFCLATPARADLRITEFLTSNAKGKTDSDGDSSDWIEIHNGGAESVDLSEYALSDSVEGSTKWSLPDSDLAAGAYKLVFASGKNRTTSDEWHTDFKLSREGGYLGLVRIANGALVSSFTYDEQRSDVSFGVYGENVTGFFLEPTPEEPNGAGIAGFVADTTFSMDRGFYSDSFEVEITTATPEAEIYYTLDGRNPESSSIFNQVGQLYEGPITIDTTTILRAQARRGGWRSSNVDTQTYLFLNDVIRQTGQGLPEKWNGEPADYEMDPRIVNSPDYQDTIVDDFKTLPALSIVMDPDDFFSTEKGIYPGKIGQDGIDKACSAELLRHDGVEGFQLNSAVRIVGQTSPNRWKIKKLSLRLRFDGEYGPGRLRYDLFGEEGAATNFNTLTVDARHNNTWAYQGGSEPTEQRRRAQYLRDQFTADLQRETGGHSPRGRYVHTFVNGIYWGMYNLHERPDDAWAETYFGGARSDYDVTRHGNVEVSGDIGAYRDMHQLSRENLSDPVNYQALTEVLDIDKFIGYMLANYVTGNTDWGPKNYYASYNHTHSNGRWMFHSWDAEKGLQRLNDNVVDRNDNGGPTGLQHRLIDNEDYRVRFSDLAYRYLVDEDGALAPANLREVYQRRVDEIDRAIILESARWGDAANGVNTPYTRNDHWIPQKDYLMDTMFANRPATTWTQLQNAGMIVALDPPTFGTPGGIVSSGHSLTMSKASIFAGGDIHYTLDGTDPRKPGGGLSDSAMAYDGPITIDTHTTVRMRTLKQSIFGGEEWSPIREARFAVDAEPASIENLRITRFNYRPSAVSEEETARGFDNRRDFEFMELSNIGSVAVDMRDVAFDDGVVFSFHRDAAITEIEPGETIYLVSNAAAFAFRYGDDLPVAGEFVDQLSNDGENIRMLGKGDATLLEFTYNDAGEWPMEADGEGSYLVLIDPNDSGDLSDPTKWRASGPGEILGESGNSGQSGYEEWVSVSFAEGTPATDNEPMADPDGDGQPNAIEFAMGSLPQDPSSTGLFEITEGPVLRYSRSDAAKDVTLAIETSANLQQWSPVIETDWVLANETSEDGVTVSTYRLNTTFQESYFRARATFE